MIHPVSEAEMRQALCEAMADIHRRGWCDGTSGNFSCVLEPKPLRLLMAPSGVDKGSVQPSQLLVVDATGTVRQGEGRASAETALHLEIVATTGSGAVLHTHSQAATLLSRRAEDGGVKIEGLEMLKGIEGITSHNCQVTIPVLGNDQDLQRLSRLAREPITKAPNGLLIAGHGLYAWGRDLLTARRHLEVLEFLLEQHWRALLLEARA